MVIYWRPFGVAKAARPAGCVFRSKTCTSLNEASNHSLAFARLGAANSSPQHCRIRHAALDLRILENAARNAAGPVLGEKLHAVGRAIEDPVAFLDLDAA